MKIERFEQNPIITPKDVPPSRNDFEVVGTFNAGVTRFNGKIMLLMRVAERPIEKKQDEELAPILNHQTGQIEYFKVPHNHPDLEIPDSRVFFYKKNTYLTSISHLRIATSSDGINFNIEPVPAVFPQTRYETFGLEDPRITLIENTYYITCKVVSDLGIATSLITTSDFKNFKRHGIIFCPENIDVVIFPEKVNGLFYALTRPVPHSLGSLGIWIASSPDMINWGKHKCLMSPRVGMYDSARLGASCVPIKTEQGWLEIYHAADENNRYCLAACLLDIKDPSKVIAYSNEPLMQPQADYEINGFFGNVIFSCGATADNDIITIYYGAADCVIAGAKVKISDILNHLEKV
jgi:predicted GH43/DUF377 family glycosyl hydrolase